MADIVIFKMDHFVYVNVFIVELTVKYVKLIDKICHFEKIIIISYFFNDLKILILVAQIPVTLAVFAS